MKLKGSGELFESVCKGFCEYYANMVETQTIHSQTISNEVLDDH